MKDKYKYDGCIGCIYLFLVSIVALFSICGLGILIVELIKHGL